MPRFFSVLVAAIVATPSAALAQTDAFSLDGLVVTTSPLSASPLPWMLIS